jgi:phosphoribosylglycinamide formyltransferase-1
VSRGRLGILISGRGSNMVALADACLQGDVEADVALVVSNVPDAAGLEEARRRGIPTAVFDHRGRPREEHDLDVARALDAASVSLVCHAGYMRILSPEYVRHFAGRALNIHPSLLPAFPGLHAQRQALEHGVKVTGATVHFLDEQVDHGAIVLQEAVRVDYDDTEETLSARILEAEHRLYPRAVGLVVRGEVVLQDGRARRVRG